MSKQAVTGASAYALLFGSWALALWWAPLDTAMGEVYRILFVHVPAAFCAFFAAFLLFCISIYSFYSNKDVLSSWGRALSEVGLLMTILTLVTGSLWGYPTWGTYWTWDARLTTTLILALLYLGYILLYGALPDDQRRAKICAALGVMIFIDVIIVYKSVSWWRTLHQPPTLLRIGGATMDARMQMVLLVCLLAQLILTAWLTYQRQRVLTLTSALEHERMASLQQQRKR